MAITDGQPVNAAASNAAWASRTQDTTLLGQVDFQNTTQSTDKDTGAVTVQGGVGIEKNLNVGGNAVISGDLTVLGNTVTEDFLDVIDPNITVNKGGNDASSEGAGITVDRTGTDGSIVYANALASKFKIGDLGSESEIITAAFAQTMTALKTFSAGAIITGQFAGDIVVDAATTGADQVVSFPSKMILKFTNVSLTSIAGVTAPTYSNVIFLINGTGADLLIKDEFSAAATDIITGTGADFDFKSGAICLLVRDTNANVWRLVGGGGSGGGVTPYQEVPTGTVDGVNDTFTLSFTPASADSLIVVVNGIVIEKSYYGLSGADIIFNPGSIPAVDQDVYAIYTTSDAVPSLAPVTEFRTITPTEVTNKKLILLNSPATPQTTLVDHVGGTSQEWNVDYTIVGNEVQWNGYALDGIIVSGYKLRIHYFV